MYYTQEQIDRTDQADLVLFLQSQGEQLTRAGQEYRWTRHDSLTVRETNGIATAKAGISERTVQNAKRNMSAVLGARRVGGSMVQLHQEGAATRTRKLKVQNADPLHFRTFALSR